MSSKHWRGATVPGPSDDLLGGFTRLMDTAGVLTPASSIASARSILENAITAGAGVSSTNPAYFDIGGIVYRADGTRSGTGGLILRPLNEVERAEDAWSNEVVYSGAAGSEVKIVTSKLPARPYDRMILAFGQMAGAVTDGAYALVVRIRGRDGQMGRWDASDAVETQTVVNVYYVPAGVDPAVTMSIRAVGSATNRISFPANASANTLTVLAFPISMG